MEKSNDLLKLKEVEEQIIGMDIGRGCVKAQSEFDGETYSCMFKSIIGLGRKLDFDKYDDPIYIEVDDDGMDYFVGHLAEIEADLPIHNTSDDKVSDIAKTLVCACLNEIAVSDQVKIMLGVPKKLYTKKILNEVINAYKGKTFKIKNKIKSTFKKVTINDIMICREADSAILEQYELDANLINSKVAMAVMGFKTLELAYYNEGFKFNDKKSKTIELGNLTMLKYVQDRLQENEKLTKDLAEIDSSANYDDWKLKGNKVLLNSFNIALERTWVNLTDVTIFCAGGTLLNLKDFPDFNYELVSDPQMAVARGLYIAGTKHFN